MSLIQVLDAHLADLIAAGEVVERPASVVKELMENAIDAGARKLSVAITGGGMDTITVTDDGSGMSPEDAVTAFLRHATSKIRTEYDLESIGTLGFRGEALAAISAVSKIELLTKRPEDSLGCAVYLSGGEVENSGETGAPNGTTLIVRSLFYNTPARRKFMKKDSYEGAACLQAAQRIALSHPEVSVKFLRDGKTELHTPGDGSLKNAVFAVLGKDIALGLTEVRHGTEHVTVSGFVSKPVCCRGSRSHQFLFLNGRHIKSKALTVAAENAYNNQKMVGKFPAYVLHIETKPNAVDCNVHPTKVEVKFADERSVFSALFHGVESALNEGRLPAGQVAPAPKAADTVTPNQMGFQTMTAAAYRQSTMVADPAGGKGRPLFDLDRMDRPVGAVPSAGGGAFLKRTAPQTAQENPADRSSLSFDRDRPVDHAPLSNQTTPAMSKSAFLSNRENAVHERSFDQPMLNQDIDRPSDRKPLSFHDGETPKDAPFVTKEKTDILSLRDQELFPQGEPVQEPLEFLLRGEAFHTYLIVEQGENMILIDKHAAHERMNFDRMKAEGYRPMVQELLPPVTVQAAPEQAAVLLDSLPLLEEFGFTAEDFGAGMLRITAAPYDIDAGDLEDTLLELADTLLTGGSADPDARRDELLHTMACKAAIKGGWETSEAEMLAVARRVMNGSVRYCPHGRPVCAVISKKELEKRFKRA